MPNIMIIGLTGMSGAGKSTVCSVFAERGFSVIDCDKAAHFAADDPAFLSELSERISAGLLNPDGSLNRQATANLIYGNAKTKEKYQRVIFPYIIYDIICQIKERGGIVILDAPTLFEAGLDIICEKIVSVTADIDTCAARITERDKISPQKARERLSSQNSAEFFKKRSDFNIENNNTEAELRSKAEKIADKIRNELWKLDSK